MNYLDLSIEQISLALQAKKVTPLELTKLALARADKYQKNYNSFVTIIDQAINECQQLENNNLSGPLFGIPYAAKDNISTKDILSTASSNILADYIPTFNATIIEKLKVEQAVLIGKTVLDELAMGGTGTNGHTGVVCNPYDKNRLAGGSSAGSATAVALGIVPFSIGSDTGDSVRKPAAYTGIVGLKPSWGRISRFGVFSFAASLDHVAFFTKNVQDSAYVLQCLAGEDKNDPTTSLLGVPNYAKELKPLVKGAKYAYIKEIIDSIENKLVKENFFKLVDILKANGAIVNEVSMDEELLKAILPTYLIISCSEATSNNANLDGIKFGSRVEGKTIDEMVSNTRSKGFSELVKRRFIIGSFCLAQENQQKFFIKAQKIRRLICNTIDELLKDVDCLIAPASGDVAPCIKGHDQEKLSNSYLIAENHLAIANFGGLPSITIPCGKIDGLPIGINLTCKAFKEQLMLDLAYGLEKLIDFKGLVLAEVE